MRAIVSRATSASATTTARRQAKAGAGGGVALRDITPRPDVTVLALLAAVVEAAGGQLRIPHQALVFARPEALEIVEDFTACTVRLSVAPFPATTPGNDELVELINEAARKIWSRFENLPA